MTAMYGGLGAAGYWSRGAGIKEIIIFALGTSPRVRVAAAFILAQVRSASIAPTAMYC